MWVAVLGLPDELYWDCSPREIDLCFVEYHRRQDTENSRFGTIAASIFNAVPVDSKQARKRKWLTWTNFFNPMTSQHKHSKQEDSVERARQAMLKNLEFGSFSKTRR